MLLNQKQCFQCFKTYKLPIIFSCSICNKVLCYDCYDNTIFRLCQFCNHHNQDIYYCYLCNKMFKQRLNINNYNALERKKLTEDYIGVKAFKLNGKYICRSCMFIDTEIISNYKEKNHYNCKVCGTFSTKNNKYFYKLTIKFLCKNGLYNFKNFFLCEKHIDKIKELKFKSIDYDYDQNQWCQKKILKKCESHNCDKLIRNYLFYCKKCTYKIIKIQKWWKNILIKSNYNL